MNAGSGPRNSPRNVAWVKSCRLPPDTMCGYESAIVEVNGQLTRRYVANGPHCWAIWIVLNEKLQCGRNLTKPPHVNWSTFRAWGRYHSRILDPRAANPVRLEGASAEEAVPFPSQDRGLKPSILDGLRGAEAPLFHVIVRRRSIIPWRQSIIVRFRRIIVRFRL